MNENEVWIKGAAMTRFGKHLDRSARDLVEEAVAGALSDAEIAPSEVQAAYVGNAVSGLMSGQESIRGQVVLRHTGLMGVPIVNVENACASSSTALHLGWQAVASGMYECVAVVGFEKLYDADKAKSFRAFNASMDLAELEARFGSGAGQGRSVFMDLYASFSGEGGNGAAEASSVDPEDLALISVKNHHHGALNPFSQYRDEVTVEQVLGARRVAGPLTVLMCSPLSDGAACLVLTGKRAGRGRTGGARIAASVLTSGRGDDLSKATAVERAAARASEMAGVGPADRATAAQRSRADRLMGLCSPGDAPRMVRDRVTWLGGRLPVNPSGGLLSRVHPIGATGAAQIVELTWQLEGRCGERQVPDVSVGLAQNAGGWVGTDAAACAVHVLQR